MTDLHTRLVAAVHARAAVARAAHSPGWTWNADYHEASDDHWVRYENGAHVASCGEDHTMAREYAAHIAANGPDVVLRQCERDIRTLSRHIPFMTHSSLGTEYLACAVFVPPEERWPCPDICDLAYAYGIEVGGE